MLAASATASDRVSAPAVDMAARIPVAAPNMPRAADLAPYL